MGTFIHTFCNPYACSHCVNRDQSVFSTFSQEELKDLDHNKACLIAKKGQVLFTENSIPAGVFCINSGKIKLSITGPDGKEQILRFLKGGDVLGYRALITNERYHSTATVLEDCTYCYFDKPYFTQLLKNVPELYVSVFKKISDDLSIADNQIVSLSQKTVRERLCSALLYFKDIYGTMTDSQTINITLSREEIADFVGTSTEGIIRTLASLKSEKLISLEGKKIKILNEKALLHSANNEL